MRGLKPPTPNLKALARDIHYLPMTLACFLSLVSVRPLVHLSLSFPARSFSSSGCREAAASTRRDPSVTARFRATYIFVPGNNPATHDVILADPTPGSSASWIEAWLSVDTFSGPHRRRLHPRVLRMGVAAATTKTTRIATTMGLFHLRPTTKRRRFRQESPRASARCGEGRGEKQGRGGKTSAPSACAP